MGTKGRKRGIWHWSYTVAVFLLIIALFLIPKQILLSPPGHFNHFTSNLPNSLIASYAKVAWDGNTNYVRSGEGTGSLDGTFTSTAISIGQSTQYIKPSWSGTGDVTVIVSTNNGASWCTVQNGQYIVSGSGCTLPASSFKYRVKLPNNSLPSKIDWIQFDYSAPVTCGNNIIEGSEQCDGTNLNGKTCTSLGQGFSGGILSCIAAGQANQCMFNTAACTLPVCGNGIKETGETCDDTNTNDGDGCSSLCQVENGWKCVGEPSRCLRTKSGLNVNDNQLKMQCSDGIDNDNDGASDLSDFSCSSSTDNDETNPRSQCQDGLDNDGNGFVDYPQDTGCDSKQDNFEFGGGAAGFCSDGSVDYDLGETCDDTNLNDGDGCSSSCLIETGYTCSGEPSICSQTNVNLECPVGYCLPRDNNGWTVYTPSSDSLFVYVSNTGNDATCRAYTLAEVGDPYNPNSGVVPCATINIGLSKTRNMMPDWLLLRRGDTWNKPLGEINVQNSLHYPFSRSGRSYYEPFVVTTYGNSNKRPILHTGEHINAVDLVQPSGDYLAINGIEFISNGTATDLAEGFVNIWGGNNMLIEDCKFEGYFHGIANQGNTLNFTIRRNQLLDNWYIEGGTWAQGTFAANTKNLLYQENVNDRNGWNPEIPYHDMILLPNKTISEWRAVTNGKFNISFWNITDPNWDTQVLSYSIDSIDFSGVNSLDDVAFKIQGAVNAKVGYNLLNISTFYYAENGQTYFLFNPSNMNGNMPGAMWVRPYSGTINGGTDISGSIYYGFRTGYLNGPGGFAGGNTRAHGVYMSYNAGNRNLYFLNNIVSRASAHGLFFSDSGVARGNLLVRNPVPVITAATGNIIEENVVLETTDVVAPRFYGDLRAQPRAFGLIANEGQFDPASGQYYSGPLVYRNNIIAHPLGSANSLGMGFRKTVNSPATTITIKGNILYDWMIPSNALTNYGNEGIGLFVQDGNPWQDFVNVEDNIFQQPNGHGAGSALVWFNPTSVDQTHFHFRNNTYYMTGSSNWFYLGGSFKNFGEWVASSGETNALNQQVNFVDPNRTVASYSASLGKPATFEAFINEARKQSKLDWRPEYTASAVNKYISDGFAIAEGCGPLGCSPDELNSSWFEEFKTWLKGLFKLD